jgi:hypothetical protein
MINKKALISVNVVGVRSVTFQRIESITVTETFSQETGS